MAAAKVAVIVGGASKHDQGGKNDTAPERRWGLGGALGLRFAASGMHIALLSRRKDVMELIAAEIVTRGGQATALQCDVTSDSSVKEVFDAVKKLGEVAVVIYNVAPPFPDGVGWGSFPPPLDVDPAYLQAAFDSGVIGFARIVKEVLPGMLEKQSGKFILSGATMALRGSAKFAFMGPVKAALRSYGQSMYQEYAPQGIHTCHVIIDGVIDSPNTESWGKLMDPADIAEQYWCMYTQPKSVWSYELQLTPFHSSVGMRL